jgi:outer membrane murein-binding lipoprotein Lpp
MADEDKRSAISFSITLSSQLISAALAMLAVEGAYVGYALGSREPNILFVPLATVAAMAFIVSVFIAGKAITAARDAGFSGGWSLDAGKSQFNWQAVLLLVALGLLGATFLASGRSKESILEMKVEGLRNDIQRFETQLKAAPVEHQKAKRQLEQQIRSLTDELRRVRQEFPGTSAKPSQATRERK